MVAPITMTLERPLRPSMSTSSCDTMRFSTSPLAFSRLGAIESISSMKIIAGELASASSNACVVWVGVGGVGVVIVVVVVIVEFVGGLALSALLAWLFLSLCCC